MILLRRDCLVFETSEGNLPLPAEEVTMEIIGDAIEILDEETIRQAAEAVLFYFKEELGQTTVSIAEFTAQLRCIRNDHFKYVWSSRGDHRLFDIKVDPQEEHNLVKKRSDVAGELEKTLAAWWSQQPQYMAQVHSEAQPLDSRQRRRLEQNGYLSRDDGAGRN